MDATGASVLGDAIARLRAPRDHRAAVRRRRRATTRSWRALGVAEDLRASGSSSPRHPAAIEHARQIVHGGNAQSPRAGAAAVAHA